MSVFFTGRRLAAPTVEIRSQGQDEIQGCQARGHPPNLTIGDADKQSNYDRSHEKEQGSSVHQHFHPQEEVWDVIEGELEITVDGVARIAGPGVAAIVPPNVPHAVSALTDGKAIVSDYPRRERD